MVIVAVANADLATEVDIVAVSDVAAIAAAAADNTLSTEAGKGGCLRESFLVRSWPGHCSQLGRSNGRSQQGFTDSYCRHVINANDQYNENT